MKILIEKLYDKLGDDYLKEDEVVVDIYTHKDEVIMKVDGALYVIPKIVIKALLLEELDKVSKEGRTLCKCGHWMHWIGTKWQHIAVILTDSCLAAATPPTTPTSEIKYWERCYYCDCTTPTPEDECSKD